VLLLPPSQNEVMFLSSEHGDADIEQTASAIDASLRDLRERSLV
jgi:glutamate-1-semialdehyde aminotransferase